MFNVYVTDSSFDNFNAELEVLREIDCRLIPCQFESARELAQKAADADALLNTHLAGIDGGVMDAMPNLKVIVRYGVGYDTIDVEAATKRGIQVANVPDYCVDEVSDHVLALTLCLIRKIAVSNNHIKNIDYGIDFKNPILPLRGAKAGIVGFGRIGRQIGEKLAVFGCVIRFYDPFVEASAAFAAGTGGSPGERADGGFRAEKSDLDSLYADSDIIILQAPATVENRHMLDAGAFAKMKRKPYVINCARGELIDEGALMEALEAGVISGAGLDVLESMPPVRGDNPLLAFENVILTPHTAWFSGNSYSKLQKLAAMEVVRVLKGGVAKSLLNPSVICSAGS